jgi:hypothetical protein
VQTQVASIGGKGIAGVFSVPRPIISHRDSANALQDNQLSGEVPVDAIAAGCPALQELDASRNSFDPSSAEAAKARLKEARPRVSASL